MKLIVGLGNPGKEFENTRHNVGFDVAELLAKKFGAKFTLSKKFNAEIAESGTGKNKIVFAKPFGFMNNSGISTRAISDFYKIKPSDIIVIHDDKDIPLGEYRIQSNRGAAGHKGVESIIEHLGVKDFTRLRIGIEPKNKIDDAADFVLSKFSAAEKIQLNGAIEQALDKIAHW